MSIFIEVAGNGVHSMNGKLPVCNDDDDDELNTDVKGKA